MGQTKTQVIPEIQGDHGRIPKEWAIAKEVEVWLDGLELDLKGDDVSTFVLQISGWKGFAGKTGVALYRILDEPKDQTIELRVRTKEESEFLWRCFLVCASEEVALQIHYSACPDKFDSIYDLEKQISELPAYNNKTRQQRRFNQFGKHKDPSKYQVKLLSRGKGLRELAWEIWNNWHQNMLNEAELASVYIKVSGVKFTHDSFLELTQLLVEGGFLSNITINGVAYYSATVILQEKSFDRDQEFRRSEIKSKTQRLSRLERNLLAGQKEIARLQQVLADLYRTLISNKIEIEVLTYEIETLENIVVSSYENDDN